MTRSSEAEQPLKTGSSGVSHVRIVSGRQAYLEHVENENTQLHYAIIVLIAVGLLAVYEGLR